MSTELSKSKDIFCAIPCYNESYNLPNLFKDIVSENIKDIADIVFIDDGSKDSTVSLIKEKGYPLIQHKKNRGYGQAVMTGYKQALKNNYKGYILFPGDGQRSASDVKKLIDIFNQGEFDVVTGSKFHIYSDRYGPIERRLGNIIYAKLAYYGWGSPIKDVLSGFKIYNVQSVAPFLHVLPRSYSFDICFSYYAAKAGLKIKETPVNCRYDDHTSKMKSVIGVSIKMLTQLLMHIFWLRKKRLKK